MRETIEQSRRINTEARQAQWWVRQGGGKCGGVRVNKNELGVRTPDGNLLFCKLILKIKVRVTCWLK